MKDFNKDHEKTFGFIAEQQQQINDLKKEIELLKAQNQVLTKQ